MACGDTCLVWQILRHEGKCQRDLHELTSMARERLEQVGPTKLRVVEHLEEGA